MWSLNIANNSANITCLSQFLLSSHSAYFLVNILIFYFTCAFNMYFSSWLHVWSLPYTGFKFIQAWASVCSLNVRAWLFSLPSSGKEELFPLWFLCQMTGWSEKNLNASLVSLPISVMCAWLTLHCSVPSLVPPIHQKAKCGVTASNQAFPYWIPLRKEMMQAVRELEIGVLWALVCPPCGSPPCLFLIMEEQVPVLLLPGNSAVSWCSGS